jgi:hypothetical protein
MRISRRVLTVGTLGAALALMPAGLVTATPPAKDNGNGSGHGANQSGPYDPHGVGQPSGNGKSENNNGKRPCAGCVGKADAKNPPGQMPGGSDANAGYECDRNQGVGKTNPAHSGCGPAPSVVEPPPGGEQPKQPPGGNPPERPQGEGHPGGVPERPAGAPKPEVAPEQPGAVLGESDESAVPVAQVTEEAPPVELEESGSHPFTGGFPLVLLGLGVLALAAGLGAWRFGSRSGS